MQPVLVVAGTRPEIVKLAPVYRALRGRGSMSVAWIATGQHTDLAAQSLSEFCIAPDVHLTLPPASEPGGRYGDVGATLARLIQAIDQTLERLDPKLVVIQGDTTSTVAAALASFGRRIPIAHVEAGLRSFDLAHPFPEEGWRAIVSQVAQLHFAPTEDAARNLQNAGVQGEIKVTGNTVIDALHWLLASGGVGPAGNNWNEPRITVTLHRRENWHEVFSGVCAALVKLAEQRPELEICFVAHANPALRDAAARALAGRRNIKVVAPLGYGDFIRLLSKSTLVLSDSGGVQEEAPALGVPVLILRTTTERPEAVAEGVAKLVGTDAAQIVAEATRLLTDEAAYRQMARVVSPFGDGKASDRIAAAIVDFLGDRSQPRRSVA